MLGAPHEVTAFAAITIDIDPEVHLGPLTLAWHGVGIALGLVVGFQFAARYGMARGLDRDRILSACW